MQTRPMPSASALTTTTGRNRTRLAAGPSCTEPDVPPPGRAWLDVAATAESGAAAAVWASGNSR